MIEYAYYVLGHDGTFFEVAQVVYDAVPEEYRYRLQVTLSASISPLISEVA